MGIALIGTNHKFSPVKLREQISFSRNGLRQAFLSLKENSCLQGAVILSTCNRVELYASAKYVSAIKEVEDFFFRLHEVSRKKVLPYLYMYEGKEAIRHLFLVASGLDSLILGEAQILGQVKSAFLAAKSACFTDGYLETSFASAVNFAKWARQNTGICAGKVSIGSLAIDFIKEKLGGLRGKKILIIGAGKVTELVLKYLRNEQPDTVFISNRDFAKAKELAFRIGQKAARFDQFPRLLKQADVIISATASPHFIIKKETLRAAAPDKLLILDLAMPRDVDPRAREIGNVELFDLEDLSSLAQNNLEKKKREAEKISGLINQRVDLLWQKFTALEPEPALSL